MGYFVRIEAGEWAIKETPEALAAVRDMPRKYKAIQRGGSSSGEKWFSWVNDSEIESAESVQDVFILLGFETRKKDGSDVFELIGYDNKNGQEDLFLAVMAPWTVDGSWLHWVGEDRAHWKHAISNGRMYTSRGEEQVIFDHATPYTYYHGTFVPVDGQDKWSILEVDPASSDLDQTLRTAAEWDAKRQAKFNKKQVSV
jgi:hypothetical protein